MTELFERIELAREQAYPKQPVAPAEAKALKTITLVAEGDSWFSYFPPPDVLDGLRKSIWTRRYKIYGKPKAGAYLNDMVYGGRDLLETFQAIQEHKPDAILFSAGGNDIAGDELFCMLWHRNAQAVSAEGNPIELNEKVVTGLIHEVFGKAYRDFISAVRQKAGRDLPVIVHGYDYVIPDGRGWGGGFGPLPGPWLDPSLTRKGYDRTKHADRRRTAINQMIDAFNEMLKALVAEVPNIFHVDLRGTLASNEWANELHPSQEGFRKVAQRFDEVLRIAVPTAEV